MLLFRLRSLPLLVLAGTAILLLGAFGDLAFHLFGGGLLAPLVGDDGYRAHLITFAGMVISVCGLLVHAVRTR
jgi:hypothetical protein